MSANRLFTFVGFAVKSNKIKYGVDNIVSCKKAPKIVLVATDLSDNSLKKLDEYLQKHGTERFTVDLERLLPERNCKAIGITDAHLAEAVKSEIKESKI